MKKIDFKPWLIHGAVIAIFLTITLVYFSPVFKGEAIRQYDMTNTKGMGQELTKYHQETGEYSQWTNSMFCGMPAFHVGPFGPSYNVYYYVMQYLRMGLPDADAAIIFTMLLAFYILLLTLRFNPWLAMIGSIGFAFSTYNFIIIEVGHITKAYAIAYIPLVVAGVLLTYRKKWISGGLLTMLAVGMEIAINHLQITYYLFIMLLILGATYLVYAIKEKTIKDFILSNVVLAVAVVFAVLPNISHLVTTQAITQESIRGGTDLQKSEGANRSGLDRDYAFGWSYGKAETFTLLVPNFVGGSSTGELSTSSETFKTLQQNGVPNARDIVKQMPLYYGPMPFTSGPVYLGALLVFLFFFGMIVTKGPEKWWILIATFLAIILSWGKNFPAFNNFMFDVFPMYNKFRVVSMTLIIAGFTVPFLAMLGLKQISETGFDKAKMMKALKISAGIVGGFLLLLLVAPGMFVDFAGSDDKQLPQWLIPALIKDRESLFTADVLRSLIFVLIGIASLWIYIKGKIKLNILIPVFIVLVISDLWTVNKRYLNDDDYMPKRRAKEDIVATPADLQILQDKDLSYRVFNVAGNPFNESKTSYFHKSIGGYHAAKIRRYQELIEKQISKNNMSVLNMLNARYFIVPSKEGGEMVQRNPNAMGNAWFVSEIKWAENADAELAALDSFNPAKTVVIDKSFQKDLGSFAPTADSTAAIKLTAYKPNELTYESNSTLPQLAVFSEIYYQNGWNAFIDGQPAPHIRANYVLRAMQVPAGKHTIVYKYEPQFFYTAQNISKYGTYSLFAALLGLGGFWFFKRRKKLPDGQ